MAIYNNLATNNIPANTGNVSQLKKSDKPSPSQDIVPVSAKENTSFSLALSEQQEQSINDTIGYDQPSAKERDALDAYRQVSTQEKRERLIDSMSFHFVV
ncbi:hypothetical protein [Psychromonas sp. 14N.309.X.WAT.B.A12]|uniref:hypothetical protein n=1 Tax=unclassified Psychromonas TaxID=2614957 RepID=UPI0025AFD8F0|nr:hypothetical protein [Psychromonas sp. 14N.309.X.WAT.B.A12]MDN2662204.1 hypothetical protein [Psychromonas sp. 14N.309.X.WAT.B.A12]